MLNRFTADYLETLSNADFVAKPKVSGRLASFDGLLMEAVGLTLPVGTVCQVGEGAARAALDSGGRASIIWVDSDGYDVLSADFRP